MEQREWNFRFAGISALIGGVLMAATIGIAAVTGKSEPQLEALGGLLVGLMASVITMQILQNRELGNIEKIARDAMGISTRASQGGAVNTMLMEKLNRLPLLPSVVHNVALCGLQAAIEGIQVEKDVHSTYIEGRRLALKCYARFWDDILDLQQHSRKPMIARLTHSSEIDIFYDKDARPLRALHSRFTKRGFLFRMLIDRESQTSERVEAYLKAIRSMHGIACVYINVFGNHILLQDNEDMEFCIVDGINNFCSEWRIKGANQVQAYSLTESPKRYNESMEAWNNVLDYIREYDYGADQVTESQLKELRDLKESFISRYDRAMA
ncbi:MAG TPA: hypothetical protein VF782_02160 [Allosphingosinicella sp.]|jgi:hypothetical protein